MNCRACVPDLHGFRLLAALAILVLWVPLLPGIAVSASEPSDLRVAHWTLTGRADWYTGDLDGLRVLSGEDGDGTLALAQRRATGRFTSAIHQTPFPLTAAAVFWTSDTADGSGLAVELRLSRDNIIWSPWYPIQHPETQADGRTYGENIVAFESAQYVQLRGTLSALTPTRFPNLFDLTVVLIDAGRAPTPAQALADSAEIGPAALDRPAIISRQAWGADPAYLDWEPEYAPVQRMVVHHTVTSGGGNPVAEVQAIYYYHAVTRGWGDIGYNYLVDAYGHVYEGRYGGDDVIGAHTARWNTGALGIALLGCYDPDDCSPGQTPSSAALDAMAGLAAWTASRRVIDPRQEASFTNVYGDPPLSLYRLAGHRDYSQYIDGQWYNATSCPGDTLYSQLPALRDEAWSRLPDDDARFENHNTPGWLLAGQVITVSLSVRNAGATPWRPDRVYLGYRWFDRDGAPVTQATQAGQLASEVPFAGSLPVTATLTAPPITGTYTLRWDLYRPGAGWFAELSPASQPLEATARVVDASSLPQRLFLPLIIQGANSPEVPGTKR